MKRTFKKVLASMLALSMLFTSSGMTTLAADVEEDAPVEETVVEEAVEEPAAEEPAIATYSAPAVEEQKEAEPAAAESAPAEEKSEAQDTSEAKESAKADDSAKTEAPAETKDSGTEAKTDDSAEKADSALADSYAKEEAAEKDEEEDEVTLIDQKLTATVKSGNAGIETMSASGAKITLEGKMPEGATVKAEPVDVEIEGVAILAAYDITIYDADGNEFEPEEGTIRVHIENAAIREAQKEDNDLFVYHMKTKNAEPEKVQVKEAEDGAVEFDAKEFSIYIVGEDEELYETDGETLHYVYKLSFYIEDDSSQPISTQTVSPGEYVEMPSVPDRENYEFVGWFSEPNGEGDQYLDYTNVMPEITDGQDHEINLYAHYIELHYVHYMTHAHEEGDEDTRVIFHSEAYTPDQTLDTSTAESLYLSEGYLSYVDETTGQIITELAVTGWQDADGTRWETGDLINWDNIDGDLILYPIVEGAYWVYYDMNGHDSIENPEPEYILASETYIGTLPEPEVSGYTFDGWYTAAEGGTLVSNTTTLESLPKNSDGSITLYAHWTETYVAYTINIWRQKATDGKQGLTNKEIANGETYDDYIGYYDYAESHYVSADQSRLKTGETPTTSIVDNWSTYTGYATTSSRDSDSAYYGFEYSNTTAQTRTVNELATKTMAADGSTIINIYYNRVTITWNFGTSRNSTATGTLIGLYDTNVSLADNVEPGGTLSSWPANSNNYLWSASNSSTNTTFKARFDLDNGTTVNWTESSSSRSYYLYFYLEVTNEDTQVDVNGSKAQEAADYGVDYTRTVNSTLYVYNQRTGISNGSFNFTDKYAGYYLVGYIDNRNGAAQTTYTNATSGGSHTFSNNGYIFNDAITTNTITLISSDKVVGVDSAGNAIETTQEVTYPDASHTVKYGAAMSNYPFPETLDGETWGPAYYYHFVGWYEDPTFTAPFSITTMPNNNVVAYADWELDDITVTFNTGTSDVEAPEDQELKATQKAADPGTLERDGYTHVGWVDQNGKVFNFDTVLYADTTLTAIWKADDESGYTMLYDLNVDNSYGLFDGYTGETTSVNGDHFTVDEELWTIEKAFPGLGQDVYDMFVGWNTAADGSGTMYYPDDDFTLEDVEIDNEGRVTLYAIWAHKNESTLILDYNYPEGYEPDDGETEITLTGDNLTAIDLEDTSGLGYHDEITVTIDGVTHTYRFDGWSTTTVGSNATDDDVDIAADATVAVDTLETSTETNANYLFAVWLEVHSITVTKEVVNDAANYTVPDDQTFSFTWSFVDGEGVTNSYEGTITIGDKGTFTIPDVASGEFVTITETQANGFTTSYNGAHTDVTDDGNGTYTFTMDDNSQEITVYNTVETNKLTVNKVWQDANGDEETDVEHDAVTVTVYEDETSLGELTLSADNDWADSLEVVVKSDATYTVREDSVDGYNTTVSEMATDETTGDVGFTVTNKEIPYIDIEVTKEWVDDGNRDGLESSSITVQLEIDQEATDPEQTLTLSESNNWTNSFNNLPKYDDDGNEINYSVEETDVPDGYTVTYTQTDNSWTITNTHEDYLVSEITIAKIWDDADDQDGKRPGSVKFELQVNGNTVNDENGESWIVELTEDDADANDPDTWTATITDHPVYVYEEGTQISYTLHEDDVAEGYTTSDGTVTITPVYDEDEETIVSYTGAVTVTNTHTPEVYDTDGTLTVYKTWDDKNNQDGIRPASVSVTLSAVDSDGDEVTLPESIEATRTITANDAWETTYEDLYKYANGKEITYTVSETAINGYTTTYDPASDDDESTESGAITDGEVTITNTHTTETIDIEGEKTWDDSDNQDGKRPESITIRLMANGNPAYEQTVTAADDWKWSFTDLDKYSSGTEIVYTITENAVSNYTTTVSGYDVTNSYTPEETTVTISKDWDDDNNRDGKRPENVTVTLTGTNGSSQDFTLNEGNNWTTTVNVPMYYNNGQLVVYSVSESTVTGYNTPVVTTEDGYNFVVTNTYTPELINETGTITVEKVWYDVNDQDGIRPESVSVTLSAKDSDGAEVELPDGVEATQEITADAEGKWTVTYEDLYKYANGGKEITYSITESAIEVPEGHRTGYTPAITGGADAANNYTFTVTNTHTPEVIGENGTITITKTWNDDNDHDAIRPTSVTFTLTGTVAGDGDEEATVVTKSATLTSEDEWVGTIEGLARYSDGKEITYTLTESLPEGYSSMITATTDEDGILTGYTVVNSHEDYTATVTVTKVWEGDEDYKDTYRPSSVTVHLMSDGVDTNQSVVLNDEDNWTDTFTNVPVFENGDEQHGQKITYTVTEENLPNGYTASETESELTQDDEGNWTETATVTNTLTTIGSEENPVTITKEWNDGETDHSNDNVSVTIYSSNWTKDDDSYYISETYTLNEENEWTATVSGLPKYTTDNTEIEYVVSEEAVEGYSTQISDMVENDDGSSTFTVTNTALLNGTGVLEVSKTWEDANDQDGIRPGSVTVQLYTGEDEDAEPVDGATLTLGASNDWTGTFTGLDQYDADGKEITYTVAEINFSDKNGESDTYTAEVTGNTTEGFTVKNTHTPETINVTGSKTWVDEGDPDEKPESITIHLLADGTEIDSVTVTEGDEWAWSFTDLPKYRDGGTEIVYTITEDAVGNYTTTYDEGTYDVTNTYSPEETTVTITKKWDDDSNRDGKRPEEVTVTLTGTNGFSQEITLNDENSWMATVNVPMYRTSGRGVLVTYTVTEDQVDEYDEPVIISENDYNFTVTNTYTPETVDGEDGTVTIKKVWDDENNQDGIRPDSVTVTLTGTVTTGEGDDAETEIVYTSDPIELSDNNNWTDSISGLYKYANGGLEITYSVTEADIAIPAGHETGYEATIVGGADEENEYTFTVINTHVPEVYGEDGTLTVNKVWNDDGNRDGLETDFITVQLEIDQETTGQTVTLNEENEWTDSFTDLPKYADGEEINYSVEETEVPDGYTATYTQNGDDWTITNTHEDYLVSELIITKEWDDADNQDGIRPDSIVVELQIDDNTVTDVNGNSWTATLTNEDVDADGNWTITVDDHPVYVDENGAEISYTLHEDTVTEGYESTDGTVEITTDDEGNYTGTVTITNTHTPETINVTGSKTWVDEGDPDEKPESITIHLLADGTEIDSATVTEGDEWAWSFTDLPKYRDGGTEIVYTITEDAVGNYTTTYDEGTYDVTNTYSPEETTVTITKEWDDDSNRDGKRPEEVTVILTGTNGFSQEITLNGENSWMATVNVPMYPNSGRGVLVTYTVTEDQVDEYDEPDITTDNGYNFTVTNTYTPELINETGTVTVEKAWDDEDDQDGIRPDSVEVTLSAVDSDGETVALPDNVEATQTITAGDENDWTVTYDGLYKYANGGKEITYSVSESEIALPEGHEGESGYTPTITGGADEENEYTFTVTNTHEPEVYGEDGTLTVNKVWNDDGNRDGLETESITVQLEIDQDATGEELTLNEANEWSDSFTDLPKYADGEEINYSVEETEVPDGYTAAYTQTGDDWTITNTHEDYLVSELTITKEWDDADNQDGIRPDSIEVELQINGSTATDADGNNWTATLTKNDAVSDNEWSVTVIDHPVFLDANGQQISYTVHEDNVTEGYAANDGTVTITETTDTEGNTVYTGEATITNIHTPAKVDVEGTKTWDDSDDADEDRPSEITIRLYAGGTAIDSQTVTADDGWTWSFEDLDKYENGVEIEYTITEDAIYHYSTTYDDDSYDVTNTHSEGKTSVTVMKVWDDVNNHDNVRLEEVTIDLLADEEQVDTLTLSGDGNVWVGSFTGLDQYDGTDAIKYTIVEEGVENGELGEYTSEITGDAATGFIITNRLDVTDWTVEKTLTNKGSGEDDAFKLGEKAEFTITVTNTGNTDIDTIDITELLDGAVFTEGDGYKLNEEKTVATIEGLAAGDSVKLYAEYTIEEKDLGTDLENSVTTSDGDPDDPKPGDKTPIPTEDPEAHLTVTKTTTSEPENGETYALGEEITYEITVENDGNRTVEDITVEDPLTEDKWTIESLAPGETWTETATHEVDEDDILAGSVVNEATVEAEDPDNPGEDVPNTPGTDEEETEEKNGHITVTKEVTSEPANGKTYAYDEEITYKITVTNDGNLTITDITVTDELTGDEWTITSLAPGASEEFDAFYKVTMEDVNNGSVTNVATVEGASPDPDEPSVPSEPGEAETTIDPIYFFPMDEEIVPDADDEASPGTWVTRESVNEYDAIEIEMSTTLPVVSGERLTAEEFSMTFHNQLETPYLVLDELDSDFTVDINGTSIDHQYYEIDTTQANRLLQFFSISDGCTFHVNVNLSALYRDEVISDDDLGTGTVRVFFYVDLETEDVNSSYTSTAWYDVAADGTVLYTSDPVTVDVYTFEIIVNAYDKETGAPLAGAEYGLYYQDNDEPVSRNGAPYIVTTDENGQGMFVGIAEGDYYVKEIVKPDEYKSITEPVTVTLAGDEESEHIFEVEFPYELADPTKTADVETAGVGDEITYTITYYNNYEEPATVTITDTLDKGVDFVSASEPYDYDEESRTVTWTIEDAAPEEEGSVQLTVQVNKNAADSTLENTAGVQVGNEAEVSTNTVGIPVEPEAGPEKSANVEAGEYVKVGDEIIYTITYFNDNSDTATVTITDTLADGVDFESATDDGVYDEVSRTVTWTIEAAAYEKGSVQLTVKVNEDAEAGSTLENTAEVQVEGEDPESSNTVDIPIEPEIPTNPDTPQDPTKTSNVKAGASVTVGDEIIYTITYYNHNEDPTDVVIVDTLDAGLDFVSATEGGVYDQDAHAVTWTIADAPHGEGSVTLTLKANETAGKGGSVKNTASVKIGDDEAKETNTVGISVKEQSSGGTTGGTTGTGAPKTADTNRMDLWLLLLVCSAGVAVGAYRRRYKRS